jgi:hypothetical protein
LEIPAAKKYDIITRKGIKELLERFRSYRNIIAHGGDLSSEETVNHDVFIKYKALVLNLCMQFKIK